MAAELVSKMRPITAEDARTSYKDLCALDCTVNPGLKRSGIKALDYFFLQHRIKAKTKRHISFYEAMHDPDMVRHLTHLVRRWKSRRAAARRTEAQTLSAMYDVFQLYYGTINQFRPAVAKWLYCSLGARTGILDFSAGWGGRCMAAMSLGIPYIGVDANTHLRSAYSRMVATLEPSASVRMFFQPSETVDFSRFDYDLVFTSPPYFTLEEYERMPAYGSKRAFLDTFFIPVACAAWRHLRVGGHMALNMPAEMYEALKSHLPRVHHVRRLALYNRHPTNAAKGAALGDSDADRDELIYVWKKTGRQHTRRAVRPS